MLGHVLLTLTVSFAGGMLLMKLRVPGGMMVGAIAASAITNVVTGAMYMPDMARTFAQIAAGACISCLIKKSDLLHLKNIWKPALLTVGSLLVVNLVLGFAIYITSPLDLVTSLFCGVPGGISDTPLIAADMGADTPKVAVMMFIRSVSGMALFPSLILKADSKANVGNLTMNKRAEREAEKTCECNAIKIGKMQCTATIVKPKNDFITVILTICVAAAFGYVGILTCIPAGALLFSLIGVLLLKLVWGNSSLPNWIKRTAQLFTGAQIGSIVGYDDFLELKYMILPALMLVVFYLLNCYVMGYVISKRFGYTRKESMLIATPAGAVDIALICVDMDVDNPDVALLQVMRLLLVVVLFPQVIALILRLAAIT